MVSKRYPLPLMFGSSLVDVLRAAICRLANHQAHRTDALSPDQAARRRPPRARPSLRGKGLRLACREEEAAKASPDAGKLKRRLETQAHSPSSSLKGGEREDGRRECAGFKITKGWSRPFDDPIPATGIPKHEVEIVIVTSEVLQSPFSSCISSICWH